MRIYATEELYVREGHFISFEISFLHPGAQLRNIPKFVFLHSGAHIRNTSSFVVLHPGAQ